MHANKFTHSNTCIKKHKNQQNKVTHAMHPKQSKGFFHQQQQQQQQQQSIKRISITWISVPKLHKTICNKYTEAKEIDREIHVGLLQHSNIPGNRTF